MQTLIFKDLQNTFPAISCEPSLFWFANELSLIALTLGDCQTLKRNELVKMTFRILRNLFCCSSKPNWWLFGGKTYLSFTRQIIGWYRASGNWQLGDYLLLNHILGTNGGNYLVLQIGNWFTFQKLYSYIVCRFILKTNKYKRKQTAGLQ